MAREGHYHAVPEVSHSTLEVDLRLVEDPFPMAASCPEEGPFLGLGRADQSWDLPSLEVVGLADQILLFPSGGQIRSAGPPSVVLETGPWVAGHPAVRSLSRA